MKAGAWHSWSYGITVRRQREVNPGAQPPLPVHRWMDIPGASACLVPVEVGTVLPTIRVGLLTSAKAI